jgi:uncharacterized protein (TIGR00255 family)
MIRSMTGFAARSITMSGELGEKTEVSVSIKALNSRYFDTTCKVHYAVAALEHAIIQKIRHALIRGHVYCTLHITNPQAFRGAIEPARATIVSYIQSIREIEQLTGLHTPLTLADILQLPNVFIMADTLIDEKTSNTILALVDELLETVNTMRIQEGAALQKDLLERLRVMRSEIDAIAQEAAVLIKEQKKKIHELLNTLPAEDSPSLQGQKETLLLSLDKMDVHEEIVRFKTHLDNLAKHLTTDMPEHGKRIDFTLQELGREINTIASKCVSALISEHTINIKVEIEKAREQAQNIL